MPEKPRVRAARLFEGVGENGEAVRVELAGGQGTFVVGGPGEPHEKAAVPAEQDMVNLHGAERRGAEEVAQ